MIKRVDPTFPAQMNVCKTIDCLALFVQYSCISYLAKKNRWLLMLFYKWTGPNGSLDRNLSRSTV